MVKPNQNRTWIASAAAETASKPYPLSGARDDVHGQHG